MYICLKKKELEYIRAEPLQKMGAAFKCCFTFSDYRPLTNPEDGHPGLKRGTNVENAISNNKFAVKDKNPNISQPSLTRSINDLI